ncbi:MAG: hypothetical protein EHM55_14150 [Acidobacteria bacterium]|nr:MAG: hypothetical protein EHM55_14150 [Acidobacteriota bacterium]
MARASLGVCLPVAAAVICAATPLLAQVHHHEPGGREQYRVEPTPAAEPPLIDGALDDPVWGRAALIETFTQQEPVEGEPATERTEVRLLYDARALYIGVHAYDSNPAGVIATEMRRDSPRLLDEDNFQIIFDTFRDSRSGYMFVTNPLGAKLEQQVFEEGGGNARGAASNINTDWNGVWWAAARRTSDGWTAEIMIPTVTLRSPDAESQLWGINFMRNIRRKNEQVFWAPIPKPYGLTQVSLAGTLSGLRNLTRGLDLRIKPFIVTGGRRDRTGAGVQRDVLGDIGLDVKYGLGSGLALDVTVNTDFAQSEVDEQQVNLTRFPLFFPEKRDFFLENSGQFAISNQGTDRLMDLFFSRRIGLSNAGQPIPIIGGARLSGKVAGNNLAIMNIQTASAFERPGENFMVARYSKDLFGRSKLGGMVVNKEGINDPHFNRTFVVDSVLAPTTGLSFHTFLARTSSPGQSDGQMAFHTRALLLNTRWNTFAEYTDIQDNFNAEVGFVPRRGIRTTKVHLERNPRPGNWIRVMEPMVNLIYTTDQHNRLLTRRIHNMLGTRLRNGAYINVWYNNWFEQIERPFTLQNRVTIPVGTYRFGEWNFSFSSNPSRRLYGTVTYKPQTFYDGTRTDANATVGLRASSRVSAELSMQRNDVDLPWGGFRVNLGIFKMDYALSPRMTIRTLSQYNSLTRQLSTSVRYNFIYRPGSDLYVAYDELQASEFGLAEVRNRQLVVKMTYLMSR